MSLRAAGLIEIARALGVNHQTVKGWRARGLLDPFTIGKVSGQPAYDLDAVAAWHRDTPPQPGRPRTNTTER